MPEHSEFAEALLDQLSVETGEEREIESLRKKMDEDAEFDVRFADMAQSAERLLPEMRKKIEAFSGLKVPDVLLEASGLDEFKMMKARKVFAPNSSRKYVDELFAAVSAQDINGIADMIGRDTPKYLVYSTYAIQYLSKISTTYGDYLDGTVYLNGFVLSSYPRIILYKRGPPYSGSFDEVRSGYSGALKMTVLEELVHSAQGPLHNANKNAAVQVNAINEELARIILGLEDSVVGPLYNYMQLQSVPDDFPLAKRANLFFMLNPDNFIVNVLGPDVMTHTKIEVDPKISELLPELPRIYEKWLGPIQAHHAAFGAMEGMAGFMVDEVLKKDRDYASYLGTFAGSDTPYKVRKGIGADFTRTLYDRHGRGAFDMILGRPPTTRELKDPTSYT